MPTMDRKMDKDKDKKENYINEFGYKYELYPQENYIGLNLGINMIISMNRETW